MCNLQSGSLPWVSAGITAASGALGAIQESINSRAISKYQSRLYSINTRMAKDNLLSTAAALNARRIQGREAAARDISNISREAERSRAAAVAAGAGTHGQSVAALHDDFTRSELDYQQSLLRSEAFAELQLAEDQLSAQRGAYSSILSGMPGPSYSPNPFAQALTIGGNSFQAYQAAGGLRSNGDIKRG